MLELKKVTLKKEETKSHICLPCPCLPDDLICTPDIICTPTILDTPALIPDPDIT